MRPSRSPPYLRQTLSTLFRPCRCYTCLSKPAEAVLLRRPTNTSKLAQWRKLTTLFYSSLITAAAAADVEAKQHRREQWDVAIAAAEQDLRRLRNNQPSRERKGVSDASEFEDDGDQMGYCDHSHEQNKSCEEKETVSELHKCEHDMNQIGHNEYNHDQYRDREVLWQQSNEDEERREAMRLALAELLGRMNVSIEPVPWELLGRTPGPDSIYAPKFLRIRSVEWSPKKLITLELAVARLALTLYADACQHSACHGVEAIKAGDLAEMLEDVCKRLKAIREQDSLDVNSLVRIGIPTYIPRSTRRDPLAGPETKLDKELVSLVRRHESEQISLSDMVAQVTRRLFTSHDPPTNYTMTILLRAFVQAKQYKLADAVRQCIFDAHIRLDEVTANAILKSYISSNDREGFNRFRFKMEGYYGGLGIANPNQPHSSNGRVTGSNGKTKQNIEKDKALWHTLLRGNVYFRQPGAALKTFYQMSEAGYKIEPRGLNGLVRMASARKDWHLGMNLWEFIEAQWMSHAKFENHQRLFQDDPMYHTLYRSLLNLCKACGRFSEYNHFYREALRHHVPLDELLLAESPRKEYMSRTTEQLRQVRRIIRRRAELANIQYQRSARAVVGTRMILAGHHKEYVRQLFKDIAQPQYVERITKRFQVPEFSRYFHQLDTARHVCESFFTSRTVDFRVDDHASQENNPKEHHGPLDSNEPLPLPNQRAMSLNCQQDSVSVPKSLRSEYALDFPTTHSDCHALAANV